MPTGNANWTCQLDSWVGDEADVEAYGPQPGIGRFSALHPGGVALDAYQRVVATVNTDRGEFDRHYQIREREQPVAADSAADSDTLAGGAAARQQAGAGAVAGAVAGVEAVGMEVVNRRSLVRPCFVHMPGYTRRDPVNFTRWGSIRFRPPTCAYALWGVRVDELAKSRKIPTRKIHRFFFW